MLLRSQNTTNLHFFTLQLTADSCPPVAVGKSLNANSIVLGGTGKGRRAGPWCQAGEHCPPPLGPCPAFPGAGDAAGSPGAPGQAGILWEEPGAGAWDPLHSAQHNLVLFILEGCGIESIGSNSTATKINVLFCLFLGLHLEIKCAALGISNFDCLSESLIEDRSNAKA